MIWQQETIFELSLYGCKPSPESDFFFFCVGQQRLNYWPCLPVNIVTKNTEARCANSLHGPQWYMPNKEKQQIFDKSLTSLSQPKLPSCFLAEDIFMCVAVSIVPPEVFFYNFRLFRRSPVLLQTFPVETELYRDVCAVFRAMCIVWLIGVPILKIFCDQHLSGRALLDKSTMTCPAKNLKP